MEGGREREEREGQEGEREREGEAGREGGRERRVTCSRAASLYLLRLAPADLRTEQTCLYTCSPSPPPLSPPLLPPLPPGAMAAASLRVPHRLGSPSLCPNSVAMECLVSQH